MKEIPSAYLRREGPAMRADPLTENRLPHLCWLDYETRRCSGQ